jgi:hypothetical protein
MTPSSSPASDRIHAPALVSLRGALLEALSHGMACMDNTSDHRQPITLSDAQSLLKLTQQIQRAVLAAACLDLSDRP